MNLRRLELKDAPNMLEWMKDSKVNCFFQFDLDNITRDTCNQYIEKSWKDEKNYHYAITNDDDEYMGTVSLKNIDKKNKNAEFAIVLRSNSQGKGFAKYAIIKILKIAFIDFKLHKVYLNVLSNNERAIKLYEKVGFIYEGEFVEHLIVNDKYINLKWFSILSNKFMEVD